MRKELKIGLLGIGLFGVLNVFFTTPKFILGFVFILSITLQYVGGMREGQYNRLKEWKRTIRM